MKKQLLLITR